MYTCAMDIGYFFLCYGACVTLSSMSNLAVHPLCYPATAIETSTFHTYLGSYGACIGMLH